MLAERLPAIGTRELASKTESIETVRIIPLQMVNPEDIRKQQAEQIGNNNFSPWDVELTTTLLTLRNPPTKTPNTITLVGGKIPCKEGENAEKITLEEAVLRNLAKGVHAYGIATCDIIPLRKRSPFSWNSNGSKITCQETLYAAELPVEFRPLALDPTVRHHSFYFAGIKQLNRIFDKEELFVPEGETRAFKRYQLIGNLRRRAKDRQRDNKLQVDGEDVLATRESIQAVLNKFEAQTRQQVALTMIDLMDIDEASRFLNLHPGWKRTWNVRLSGYKLVDENSRNAFNSAYKKFLEKYLTLINHRDPLIAQAILVRDFWRACSRVYMEKSVRFNKRLPIQGNYLEARNPKFLGSQSQRYFSELRSKEPNYFTSFLHFIMDALDASDAKDIYAKLIELRRLKIGRRSISKDQNIDSEETVRLLNYNVIIRNLYEKFMETFLPRKIYNAYRTGLISEEDRLHQWRIIYARHSQNNDIFIENLTSIKATPLASHPAVSLALNTDTPIQSDQLVEHILGCFGINPYRGEPVMIPPFDAYEYRRKMIGIIMDIVDARPHLDEQIAEDTYFLRDILRELSTRRIKEEPYLLVYQPEKSKSQFIPQNTPWQDIDGQILQKVSAITTEIDGIPLRIAYFFDSKEFDELKRKILERDLQANRIFDITRFSIVIDTNSIPSRLTVEQKSNLANGLSVDINAIPTSLSAEDKKRVAKMLIYRLETKIVERAEGDDNPEVPKYRYTEKKRKDELVELKATGGSGASEPLPTLKKYITLTLETPIDMETQTQEVRFMDLEGTTWWLLDFPRYSKERLRESKYQAVIKPEGVIYSYMTYPVIHVLWPPVFPEYRTRYIDLMERRKSESTLSHLERMVLKWTRRIEAMMRKR